MQKLIAEKISAKYDVEDNTDFITLRINKDDLLHVMKILKHEKEFSFNHPLKLFRFGVSKPSFGLFVRSK